jgi:energy-converting hydrogenase B subunit C
MFSASLLELIQSILLIIIAIITIIVSIGILRLDKNMNNVVYARIHILGVIDIASVIAFICLGDPILGILYFILAPFTAHAMAHGYFYGEDEENNKALVESDNENKKTEKKDITEEIDSSSFYDNVRENNDFEDSEDKITISTLKITEDE